MMTSIAIAIICLLYLLYTFAIPQLTRFRFRSDLSPYDLGIHGFGPSRSYVSFEYESPEVEIFEWGSGCDDRFTFLAPRGDSIAHPGPMILDAKGDLVWMKWNWGTTQNFQVQRYRGEDYLTYWEGSTVEGRSEGLWYMLDSSYTQRYEISPIGYSGGDLHEFHITKDDTALVTIYDPVLTDLSSVGGSERGWIHDGVFQDIDIETGELLFEWRASDHFAINATYEPLGGDGKERSTGFDFFHINSADKDEEGNYLISSRHLHAVILIDRETGNVTWVLGGKLNEFTDLSDGQATNFAWQHDARLHENGSLTLFDNSVHSRKDPEISSRGVSIQLDISARTAALNTAYYHPQDMRAVSQGNVQILDTGNAFVGWGHSAAYSEFTPDGQPVCDVHYGASAYYSFGRVQSYRISKGTWVGRPHTLPDAVVVDDHIYASWNGATEIVAWQLEVWDLQDIDGMTFNVIDTVPKGGFETAIEIPEDMGSPYFRVTALDTHGEALGISEVLQRGQRFNLADVLVSHYWMLTAGFVASGAGVALGVCRWFRHRRAKYHLVALDEDGRV
ncbi:hypothetical protein ASPWEDRAFT_121845 [Aspergillus wentii DTO 134E9]|uniref:Arylsulfotransferase N-terminal domain-containing protein n=1 Tax=Aspergillus wentii DTO 134E9 TaxID=1073089 RepID=A0A1L9R4B3_ASPWE|nr:uncharacterized protein ASPWEDRAFT_121845 [Aspergillus wentii DTO 134E9]OJJ29744.1 hypothetical protein ASPWEDRAFT_121845 [Aspergillus wentii DTO 134E9]